MKKQIMLAVAITLFGMTTVMAQGGGNFQRRTPEERMQMVHQKLDSAFKMDADKLKQADDIFLTFYKDSDSKMDELRAGGQPDRQAMMAARQKLVDERDTKLKAVLTEEQMKIFKESIEPSLRPQRGNRGGRS